jgi:hypothetical protein
LVHYRTQKALWAIAFKVPLGSRTVIVRDAPSYVNAKAERLDQHEKAEEEIEGEQEQEQEGVF